MKKILFSLGLLIAILMIGTFGYMWIEDSSFLDGLYMTMITITTVGYSEVVHLSPAGKLFTMVIIFLGVGFVLYLVSKITETVVEGGLQRILGRITMEKKVAKLKDHYIVCGYGRIGKEICKSLKENNRTFVVVERDRQEVKRIDNKGYFVLEGEASDDEVLLQAGIKQAKGLIAVVSSDADNVYIVLSARGLNPDLFIMARSSGVEGTETKLLRAGANKVVSPYFIGAIRMAQLVVRPTVVDFVDLTVQGELGLRLEELSVSARASFVNKTLMGSDLRQRFDVIVVAIKSQLGEMLFNPSPHTEIREGDTLVVLGKHDNIKALEVEL